MPRPPSEAPPSVKTSAGCSMSSMMYTPPGFNRGKSNWKRCHCDSAVWLPSSSTTSSGGSVLRANAAKLSKYVSNS
eukprot:1761592-Prymnesium_polylepis.2